MKNRFLTILFFAPFFSLVLPAQIFAAQAPAEISAPAYAVMDVTSGAILYEKNSNVLTIPASLTKIVTALVVMDTKPDIKRSIPITRADQVMGACGQGGGCIKAKAGTEFTIDGLLHAALLPSANNAAAALARSTGLTPNQFAARMNKKVKSLGAMNSNFVEPTGMSEQNIITASDFAKILAAAFSHPHLRKIGQKNSYYLESTNNAKYNKLIRNSNGLLGYPGLTMIGGKTGYLQHKFSFASVLKPDAGSEMAVVVLQEDRVNSAWDDTVELARASTTPQAAIREAERLAALAAVAAASAPEPPAIKWCLECLFSDYNLGPVLLAANTKPAIRQ